MAMLIRRRAYFRDDDTLDFHGAEMSRASGMIMIEVTMKRISYMAAFLIVLGLFL